MGEPLPKQVLDSAVDPEEIVQQTFDLGRRGFDQEQVQQYLRAVADSLQDAQQREADMRSRLGKAVRRAEKAEQALRTPVKPDHAELHRQLGDEVTLVLEAAHVASKERAAEAEESAKQVIAKAEVKAADIVGEGRAEADAIVKKAASRIERTRDECDGLIREAEEARGQILEDMERRRRQARAQVERLRVGRDRLLRSYDVVRRTLDETTVDLKSSLKEAKVRGDSAARSITAEPLANRQQLETELADAKLIGRIKISKPEESKPAEQEPEPEPSSAPTPRKPRLADQKQPAAKKNAVPAQPKAPAVAPILSASPVVDDEELAQLEDDNLNVVEPSDEIEEVTAIPAPESENELFALLRIQSSKPGTKPKTKAKTQTKTKTKTKTKTQKLDMPGLDVPGLDIPGLDAQRDAVIADAAKQLEKRLKRALADEQNDLLASIRASKKKKNVALTEVVGDLDTHVKRYVVAINEVAVVTYGAGAALVDAEAAEGHLPAGAVEELLEADVVLPIRERLESLDALEVDGADNHLDPVRAFYRQRKTDHLGFAASRLAQLLCVAGLHDAQPQSE